MSDNGNQGEKLTPKKRLFVGALAVSATVKSAAQSVGVGERTAWRYMGDPAVRAAIAERQSAVLAQVTDGVLSDMSAARELLLKMMGDPAVSDGVRVRAALGVLEVGLRLFEMISLNDRVAELERQVLNGQHNNTD